MDLRKKVVNSVFWLSGLQVADQVVGFVRLLVLTHFLSPNEFGLVGIAWLVMQIITAFTQPGLYAALIQTNKNVSDYLNTVWTFLILRGLVLCLCVFLMAPFISQFFNELSIVPLIRALSFIFILESLTNIGMVIVQRELDFRKQFFHVFTGTLVDFMVSVSLAMLTGSVWAIVCGLLANNIVKVATSYVFSDFRPRLDLHFKKIKELTSFSRWIFLSNILMFIYSQGDDILVGRVLGSRSLGLYQMAYKISNLPSTQINLVFASVMLPAMSKMQNNLKRVSIVYLQYLQITAFLAIYVGTGIIYFAQDFVTLFLGDEWIPIVLGLQILTIWGTLRSIGATTGSLWQALGVPKLITMIQAIQVLILVIAIYPLTVEYGITGTAWAAVVASLIPNLLSFGLLKKYSTCSLLSVIKVISFPVLSALMSIVILTIISNAHSFQSNIILFVVNGLLFSVFYLGFSILLDKLFKNSLFDTLYSLSEKISILQKPIIKKALLLLIDEKNETYEG